MSISGKPFDVDTSPTKEAVVNSLTRDISDKACIFDLIDNAVDAARNTIFDKLAPENRSILPENYTDFWVSIEMNAREYSIEDNCGGISPGKLKDMVLRFGQRSSHEMGVGIFGVGLNRALFKLGNHSIFETDNGKYRSAFTLNAREYLREPNWLLRAVEFPTNGKTGTIIRGSELFSEISEHFGSPAYVDNLRREVGMRYARFLKKGLKIIINGIPATNNEIHLRADGPYEARERTFKTKEGVFVIFKVGEHTQHRFKGEEGYDAKRNANLTEQYGWNIICNDRAIVVNNTERETGWETSFHSEFYGFVGYVDFIHSDPSKLPWNTTKTDVDLNNNSYRDALEIMREFTKSWRSYCNKQKNRKKTDYNISTRSGEENNRIEKSQVRRESETLHISTGSESDTPRMHSHLNENVDKGKIVKKRDHNRDRFVLPKDINEKFCQDKHLALVHEAQKLDMGYLPYSGLALIRNLFESSATVFLRRHNHYPDVKKFAINYRMKDGAHITKADEKKIKATLDEMVKFLLDNPHVLQTENDSKLRHSLRSVAKRQEILNAAVHDVDKQINQSEAYQIRDEIVPILRHLIET